MGYEQKYASSEEIFNELASVTPSYGGITFERIETEGLHWPCPNPEHPGTPVLHKEQFTAGKGTFHAIDYIPPAEQTDEEYPMYLTTGRLLYHYHTGTMTMRTDGLNEIAPECFVEMSREDAGKYELSDGASIQISSRRGTIDAKVKISSKAATGTVFIPFHYAKAAANRLTNAELDPISGIPEYKVCAVRLEKAG
jgi:predicted molibdopterin-dependent oxidoreductase YjgC